MMQSPFCRKEMLVARLCSSSVDKHNQTELVLVEMHILNKMKTKCGFHSLVVVESKIEEFSLQKEFWLCGSRLYGVGIVPYQQMTCLKFSRE